MDIVMVGLEILRRALSKCGPYIVMEIVLPGGTLLALLIYLYRRYPRLKNSLEGMSIGGAVERL